MRLADYKVPEPGFEKLFRAEVLLNDAYPLGEIGEGYQEIVAVTGGHFEGVINGSVMNFGGDWGLLHSGDINEINTKYLLRTDDGAYISIKCKGKLIMNMEVMEQVCGNEELECDYYFREAVSFVTGDKRYHWLNELVAVGVSIITPGGHLCIDVYKLT